MASNFSGLSTALTALTANRRGMDVSAQNIANANTEGYSRQRADLESLGGTAVPALWSTYRGPGDGVMVADINRLRDAFLDARNNAGHAGSGYLSNEQQLYGQLEQLVSEPGDQGLQAQLADMWGAWHDVGNNPGDLAARNALLQQATTITNSLNSRHDGLSSLFTATRDQLDAVVADVNATAAQIAQLNQAVVRASGGGVPANELADQRDKLVLHLADLTGATTLRQPNGGVDVLLGGAALVSGQTVRNLTVTGARALDNQVTSPVSLQWQDTGTPAVIPSGQVSSVLQTLTTTVPYYSDQLDQIAATLASTVNTQHAAGYDLSGTGGGAFFTGTTAGLIGVAITDPALVAAASTPGGNLDGGNADAMAGLATAAGGVDLAYRQLVANLGVTTASANQRAAIQTTVTQNAGAAVAAASGVSLDEEMTNMITYQRGYEAAARVVSTVDSMLGTLINMI
ncbi:MAG: flagellar hook-associated protein 1 [Mycobacteriales bacterium]|jgi:flagellar hook-associated protein 1 FlgK